MGHMNVKIIFQVFSLPASTQLKICQDLEHLGLCFHTVLQFHSHYNNAVPLVPEPRMYTQR